jgi:hypothetical protein
MTFIKKFRYLPIFLFVLLAGTAFAEKASNPKIIITSSTSDTAGCFINEDPITKYPTVWGITGEFTSDPSTWTITPLSPTGTYLINRPVLISNPAGDLIVAFAYYEPTFTYILLGAAMLPNGSSTWTFSQVSNSAVSVNQADQSGYISPAGQVVLQWSENDLVTDFQNIWTSTTTISASPTWSTPVQSSP